MTKQYSNAHFIDHSKKNIKWVGRPIGKYEIAEDVAINDAVIDITGGVYISKGVHFGHQVMVLSCTHPVNINKGKNRRGILECAPIHIRENAYIASRAIILSGVTIGEGAYIAAGAIVNKDIPSFELWGGAPARFIRKVL